LKPQHRSYNVAAVGEGSMAIQFIHEHLRGQ
jgi:hypothetical protein